MELKDTIDMMTSSDYKERFKAEFHQLLIRYDKLKGMLDKWDKNELNFTPTCPRGIYDVQIKTMENYLMVLILRAYIENVPLR